MARARNIKPGFFKNELLVQCSPHARLLFAGLWCWADRAGRLEDRPVRLRAEIFPYEDVDVSALLDELADKGFVLRYEVAGRKYIQINTFQSHQSPHVKEPESIIPAPGAHQTETGPAPREPVIGNQESAISNQQSENQQSARQREHDGKPKPVTVSALSIPACLDTPEVRESLEAWLVYKRKRRQAYTDPAHLELKLAEFMPFGPLAFVQAVNKSIGNNWAGLFSPGDKAHATRAGPGPGQSHDPDAPKKDPHHGRM